jgi:hypothetical protein
MENTLKSEVKELEVIRIGSTSPVRYLPMTEFDHDEDDELDEECESDYRDDDESDDRNYYSSLYDLEAA